MPYVCAVSNQTIFIQVFFFLDQYSAEMKVGVREEEWDYEPGQTTAFIYSMLFDLRLFYRVPSYFQQKSSINEDYASPIA